MFQICPSPGPNALPRAHDDDMPGRGGGQRGGLCADWRSVE